MFKPFTNNDPHNQKHLRHKGGNPSPLFNFQNAAPNLIESHFAAPPSSRPLVCLSGLMRPSHPF